MTASAIIQSDRGLADAVSLVQIGAGMDLTAAPPLSAVQACA
jgi:hypothetical protein